MSTKEPIRRLADLNTGDVFRLYPAKRRKHQYEEDFILTYQTGLAKLAKDKTISGQSKDVLLFMLSRMKYENEITLQQNYIAEELEISPQRVSAAIRKLIERGILIKAQKHGHTPSYLLNQAYGWKGKSYNRTKPLKVVE